MAVVGLDIGSKRIGVAVADPSQTFALPVAVIERSNVRDDVERILEMVREYGADELVVGDPVALSGRREIAAESIDRFVERLARVYTGRIHRVDERMTTAQATKSLISADVSRKKRRTVVDKMAAALILETFLSRRRGGGVA